MALSKKRAPRVQDPQLSRVFSKIYDDINELINSVNQGETSLKKNTKGKPGDIRVVKDSSGAYFIEAKTDEGWIQSNSATASGFKFRESD